jgi:hypothetical protein
MASGIMKAAVSGTYNQNTVFAQDSSIGSQLDTEMWLTNQAALSAWWQSNNGEQWKSYMKVLYNVVNIGLGQNMKD